MNPFGKNRIGIGVSLGYPLARTGLLMLLVLVGFLEVVRLTAWLFGSHLMTLSSAGIVIFAGLAASLAARYLLVAAEAVAEGYDLPPALPDPREVEELFGAFLAVFTLCFFAFLPLAIAAAIGVAVTPVFEILVAIGGVYLPMGIVGVAATGEIAGCFPTVILPAMLVNPSRYAAAAGLSGAAALLFALGWGGPLDGLPLPALVGLDLVAIWLLLGAVHRAGAIHREDYAVRAMIPFPTENAAPPEEAMPHRPMSEIERALLERRRAAAPKEGESAISGNSTSPGPYND